MKQTKQFFSLSIGRARVGLLLMAVIMMAMSPQRMWAQYLSHGCSSTFEVGVNGYAYGVAGSGRVAMTTDSVDIDEINNWSYATYQEAAGSNRAYYYAKPDDGCRFVGWTIHPNDHYVVSTDNPCVRNNSFIRWWDTAIGIDPTLSPQGNCPDKLIPSTLYAKFDYEEEEDCAYNDLGFDRNEASGSFEPIREGDGTAENPYQISNVGQLYWFANQVNNKAQVDACAELTQDISLCDYAIADDGTLSNRSDPLFYWLPIGYKFTPGGGMETIVGTDVDTRYDYSRAYKGTFDGKGHTIKGLYYWEVSGVGIGLFGVVKGGTIKNLGVVDSYFNAIDSVGVICGELVEGTIENCYSSGSVWARGCRFGQKSAGGICGICKNGATIKNCYTTDAIPIGTNKSTATSVRTISADGIRNGELCWLLSEGNDGTWSQRIGTDLYPRPGGDNTVYHGHEGCKDVYSNSSGLNQTQSDHQFTEQSNGFCSVCGTCQAATLVGADGNACYEIGNAGQLTWFANQVNAEGKSNINAKLTADINMAQRNWIPLKYYCGTFDGNGHTINHLTAILPLSSYVGFIGYAKGATVKHLGIVDCNFQGVTHIGGVCGFIYDGTTITNCYVKGKLVGTVVNQTNTNDVLNIGGVCAVNHSSTITNCYATTSIYNKGDSNYYYNKAGVSRYFSYSNFTISNCYSMNYDANIDGLLIPYVKRMSEEAFKSGEVCWLLNGTVDSNGNWTAGPTDGTQVWYQKIGTDDTPVLARDGDANIVKKSVDDFYYNGEPVTLNDATKYEAEGVSMIGIFAYKRTFESTNWTTWYVPFDLKLTAELAQKYAFSRINNVHQYDDNGDGQADRTVIECFQLMEGATIKANCPYLVKAITADYLNMNLELNNVTLTAAQENSIDCQSVDYKYTFTGTYTGIAEGAAAATQYSLFDNAEDDYNGWKPLVSLSPQRHYLTITSLNPSAPHAAPARIQLQVVGEEEETGLTDLQFDNLQFTNGKFLENGQVVIVRNGKKYNVNGQEIK